MTAPDLERLARTPWPIASLASSGIKAFNSALDRSCSTKACRVLRNTPANSAPLGLNMPLSLMIRADEMIE